MTEIEQRDRYEHTPWLFYFFNSFTAWMVFLMVILLAGQV